MKLELHTSPREWLRHWGQRLPWHVAGHSLEERNIRNLYTETAWFGLLSGVTATFVSVYALRLGATTGQVGWLTALPALVNVVWLLPAARLIERQRRRLPIIVAAGWAQRLGYLAMALMPFVLSRGRVEALIALNAAVTLPTAVIGTAVTALLPDLAPPDKRGQLVSVRWLILAVTATLAALLGGKFLDLVPVPLNYQALLGVAAGVSLLSLVYLKRIQVPDRPPDRAPVGPRPGRGWRQALNVMAAVRPGLASIRSQRPFVRFALAAFVLHWGLYLPAALWSVLRVRDLKASDTWIGLIAVVIDAATIAGYFLWGKVRARRGDRWLLLVTSLGVSLYAGLTAAVPTMGWMVPTSLLGGFTWAGCNLALFNVMLAVCPAERRASYVALYTSLMNVAAFLAPLLGAAAADGLGIRWAFVLAAGVRLAGVALFALLLRPEP